MSAQTGIEWTDATWNPLRGCSNMSDGCRNCYAAGIAYRFSGEGQPYEGLAKLVNGRPTFNGTVRLEPDALQIPLRWVKGRRIFVNSMSDLFHAKVPYQYIADVFAVMSCTTRHEYQVLTKRPERVLQWLGWLRGEVHRSMSPDESRRVFRLDYTDWPRQVDALKVWPSWTPHHGKRGGYDNCGPLWPLENVIIGASIESTETAAERFPILVELARRGWRTMVSMEPLLERVIIPDDYLALGLRAWVVCGGESGQHARPSHPDWLRSLRDQCAAAGVPFLFKQWGEWLPMMGHTEGIPVHGEKCTHPDGTIMGRAGKKAAGRLLDGREHSEFPQ